MSAKSFIYVKHQTLKSMYKMAQIRSMVPRADMCLTFTDMELKLTRFCNNLPLERHLLLRIITQSRVHTGLTFQSGV